MTYLKSFIAGSPTSQIPLPEVGQNSLHSIVPLPLSTSYIVGFLESKVYAEDETVIFVVRPKAVPKNFCHDVSAIATEVSVPGIIPCNFCSDPKTYERLPARHQWCLSAPRSSSLLYKAALRVLSSEESLGQPLVCYSLRFAICSGLLQASISRSLASISTAPSIRCR